MIVYLDKDKKFEFKKKYETKRADFTLPFKHANYFIRDIFFTMLKSFARSL
jgi:hypothetical protein